jgi:hypothetical protein
LSGGGGEKGDSSRLESSGLEEKCLAAGLCIADLLLLGCRSASEVTLGDGIGLESSTPEEWSIVAASMVVVDFARA